MTQVQIVGRRTSSFRPNPCTSDMLPPGPYLSRRGVESACILRSLHRLPDPGPYLLAAVHRAGDVLDVGDIVGVMLNPRIPVTRLRRTVNGFLELSQGHGKLVPGESVGSHI